MNKNNGYREIFENFWKRAVKKIVKDYGERNIIIYYLADDIIGSTCAGYFGAVLNELMQKQNVGYKAAIDRIRNESEFSERKIIEEMMYKDNIILGNSADLGEIKKIAKQIAEGYKRFAYPKDIHTDMEQLFEELSVSNKCEIPSLLYAALVEGEMIDMLPIVDYELAKNEED